MYGSLPATVNKENSNNATRRPPLFLIVVALVVLGGCLAAFMNYESQPSQSINSSSRIERSSVSRRSRRVRQNEESLSGLTTEPYYHIVAHRGGMSGLVPEHSVVSNAVGAQYGADLLEPDAVMTKDGVFVLFHDVDIGSVTNVKSKPEFADREYTATFYWRYTDQYGIATESIETRKGFFIWNFTLAEIKTLRLVSHQLPGSPLDGLLSPLTLDEYCTMVKQFSTLLKRQIGIMIELKYYAVYAQMLGQAIGGNVEQKLLDVLATNSFLVRSTLPSDPTKYYYSPVPNGPSCVLQSFNIENIVLWKTMSNTSLAYLTWENKNISQVKSILGLGADGLGVRDFELQKHVEFREELMAEFDFDYYTLYPYTYTTNLTMYADAISTLNGDQDAVFSDDVAVAQTFRDTVLNPQNCEVGDVTQMRGRQLNRRLTRSADDVSGKMGMGAMFCGGLFVGWLMFGKNGKRLS